MTVLDCLQLREKLVADPRFLAAREAPCSLKLADCFRRYQCRSDLFEELFALACGFFPLGFLRADVDFGCFFGSAELALLAAAEVSDNR